MQRLWWTMLPCIVLAGCGEFVGAVPEQGYATTTVSYEPRPNPIALIADVPFFDPTQTPESVLELPQLHRWKSKMPIAFVGDVQNPGADWDATVVRFEIRPLISNGKLSRTEASQTLATRRNGDENMSYRLDWRAPSKPGRYQITVKSIGPSLDFEQLETFVSGEVIVE